ncbi:MAG: GCN5-related N-acetyltransferase [Paenibacillaceae bacterium]|jgi:GNAT superfamily N-acetyltransferase|nr:GCN5-related N-acetyltransferase [Paenibacillaceae bacterium]
METLSIEICSLDSLDLLALLNSQLIEDEQHDNSMTVEQLRARMEGFLTGPYKAYLFKEHNEVKGYALINHQTHPLYLRQFFICRGCRRQGVGRRAFNGLLQLTGSQSIDIEVLSVNERGRQFWQSLGFVERSIYMRRQ